MKIVVEKIQIAAFAGGLSGVRKMCLSGVRVMVWCLVLFVAALSCTPKTDIRSVEWRLVSVVSGDSLLTPGDDKVPTLKITEEGHASGSLGCNRFTGSVTIDGNSLRFGPVGSTRMFCPDGMEVEDAMNVIFTEVDNFNISGSELTLLKGKVVLATFTTQE